MADIITTLHKKDDNTINVYPNIKAGNIPSASITQDKLANGAVGANQIASNAVTSAKIASSAVTASKIASNAVTNTKIEDGAVTTAKLANGAVDNSKIASNAVSTSSIVDGAVNNTKLASNSVSTSNIINNAVSYSKLSLDLQKTIIYLERTFNFYIGDSDDGALINAGTFTASEYMTEFSVSDINSAFNFNKAQADYTETDLEILTEFILGISYRGFNYGSTNQAKIEVINGSHEFYIVQASNTDYHIEYSINGTTQFLLQWNPETMTITQYTNTKYIYIYINRLINQNI